MSDRFTWTHHPVGCTTSGVAGDVRADIWLPDWEGRQSGRLIVKLARPGHRVEYAAAPTISTAKELAEKMLAEAEGEGEGR